MKSPLFTLSFAVVLTTALVNAQYGSVLWEDNFDTGSLQTDYWTHDIGNGMNGWGNGELQYYQEANAEVADGKLKIYAVRNENLFTSARLNTKDKVEVKYAKIEALIKVPKVDVGLWPAFWTMGANFNGDNWPACGEIDIMEVGQGIAGNKINERVVSAAHWLHGEPPEGVIAVFPGQRDTGSLLYNDFYLYTLDWTPNYLATYINGTEIWRMDIDAASCASCEEFHQPHFLQLNVAVGGGFTIGNHSSCGYSSTNYAGGCPVPTAANITASFPAAMEVEYVRIIHNGETEIFLPNGPDTTGSAQVTDKPSSAPSGAPTEQEPPRVASETDKPTDAPSSAPTEDNIEEFQEPPEATSVTDQPTKSPSEAPTPYDDDHYDDYYYYYHSSSSSKSGKMSGGKMSGGKMSGGKMSGGKMSSSKKGYSKDEIEALCSQEKPSGGGKMSKSMSKSKKSMSKSKKSDSSDYDRGEWEELCGSSTQVLTTGALEASAAPVWSPRFVASAILLLPALLWL